MPKDFSCNIFIADGNRNSEGMHIIFVVNSSKEGRISPENNIGSLECWAKPRK